MNTATSSFSACPLCGVRLSAPSMAYHRQLCGTARKPKTVEVGAPLPEKVRRPLGADELHALREEVYGGGGSTPRLGTPGPSSHNDNGSSSSHIPPSRHHLYADVPRGPPSSATTPSRTLYDDRGHHEQQPYQGTTPRSIYGAPQPQHHHHHHQRPGYSPYQPATPSHSGGPPPPPPPPPPVSRRRADARSHKVEEDWSSSSSSTTSSSSSSHSPPRRPVTSKQNNRAAHRDPREQQKTSHEREGGAGVPNPTLAALSRSAPRMPLRQQPPRATHNGSQSPPQQRSPANHTTTAPTTPTPAATPPPIASHQNLPATTEQPSTLSSDNAALLTLRSELRAHIDFCRQQLSQPHSQSTATAPTAVDIAAAVLEQRPRIETIALEAMYPEMGKLRKEMADLRGEMHRIKEEKSRLEEDLHAAQRTIQRSESLYNEVTTLRSDLRAARDVIDEMASNHRRDIRGLFHDLDELRSQVVAQGRSLSHAFADPITTRTRSVDPNHLVPSSRSDSTASSVSYSGGGGGLTATTTTATYDVLPPSTTVYGVPPYNNNSHALQTAKAPKQVHLTVQHHRSSGNDASGHRSISQRSSSSVSSFAPTVSPVSELPSDTGGGGAPPSYLRSEQSRKGPGYEQPQRHDAQRASQERGSTTAPYLESDEEGVTSFTVPQRRSGGDTPRTARGNTLPATTTEDFVSRALQHRPTVSVSSRSVSRMTEENVPTH